MIRSVKELTLRRSVRSHSDVSSSVLWGRVKRCGDGMKGQFCLGRRGGKGSQAAVEKRTVEVYLT